MSGHAGSGALQDARPAEPQQTLDPSGAFRHALALQQSGRLADAHALYLKILQAAPDHFDTLQHLAILEARGGRLTAAEQLLRKAIGVKPKAADACSNHGLVLYRLARYEEALESYDKAIEIDPAYAAAHNGRGNVLARLRRYEEMIASFERAIAIKPDYVDALCNRGVAYCLLARYDEAIADYRSALAINANHASAWFGLCDVHYRLGQYATALAMCSKGLALEPNSARGIKQLGLCHEMMGNIDDAIACFRKSLALAPADENTFTVLIFALDFLPSCGFAEHQQLRKQWWQQIGAKIASKRPAAYANVRDPERRLVLGYVSGDFRSHSAAFTIRPVLRNHDKSRFEVICYSNSNVEDAVTRDFMAMADKWRNTWRLTDDALARQIESDKVDILIDLSGHSEGNRLTVFARKPAPIQMTGWGHATGTGLPTIDVLFADPVLIPAEVRPLFAERIHDLPCAITIEPPPETPAPGDPPLIARGHVTYGVFNRISKVSDGAIRLWAEILARDPQSRLVFKHSSIDDATVRAALTEKLAAHGVDAGRVDLLGGTSRTEHLRALQGIDVSLDPFPQNGGISTWESLYAGVPVIARLGNSASGRISASILSSLGLDDWIARSDDDYVAIARRVASMPERLKELRHALPGMIASAPSGNNAAYAEAVETAYRNMWRDYCRRADAQVR